MGRCWTCHLDHLRARGQGDRADRLVRLKELQDDGRLDWHRLVLDFAASYAVAAVEPEVEDARPVVDASLEGTARWRV